jgi:hypothetical protein
MMDGKRVCGFTPFQGERFCVVHGDCRRYLIPLARLDEARRALDEVARRWDPPIGTPAEELEGLIEEVPSWMHELEGKLLTFTDPREED